MEKISAGEFNISFRRKTPKIISFPPDLKTEEVTIDKNKRIRIILIASLISITAFFQYFTDLNEHRLHIFYQSLFFLPVILAGFWLGLRTALATSLTITLVLLPFTFIYWNGFSAGDFNNVMEMVLYNGLAPIVGVLKDQEKVEEKRLREGESLAAMGKAVSSLAHDLKTPLIGIGGLSRIIQKGLKEEILVPFFTTKQGGTGLGLPIAKKIIEAHQGYLEVLNNSEKGTTIRMAIPFV